MRASGLDRKLFRSCGFLAAALMICLVSRAGFAHAAAQQAASPRLTLHTSRSSPLDLEVSGELPGVENGGVRYVSRDELLALPQTSFIATGDANFTGSVAIRGVTLDELARNLGVPASSDLVVAICNDLYRANYPRAYIAAQHPVLVLEINGKGPAKWPKDAEGHGANMGPYLISHEKFTSGSGVLSHADQPQIPWGVVRLEFRNEKTVFGAIAPRGATANSAAVQNGFAIAKQNCFRCHNMGTEGGQKSGHPWLVLSAWATAEPGFFQGYIHNPRAKNVHADMPAFPDYDAATLQALTAYFSTFTSHPAANPGPAADKKKP